jgi:phosphatidylglycerol:prolipoprotein diacylglycerol transferase
MHPILFKIGSFTISTYGFFVFLGVLVAYLIISKEAKKEVIDKEVFSSLIFWVLIFSFLGARIFYIFINFKDFLKTPTRFIFSRSGFVFYGGIIFGLISSFYLCLYYKINFLKFADIVSLGIPLGHALGRIGCFFYGCCYGKPTDSFFGIRFPLQSPAGILKEKVIPTQLISSFFLLLLFIFLKNLKKRKRFEGEVFVAYLFLYGIFRFFIEFFRGDPRPYIFYLSVFQWVSLSLIIFSSLFWLKKQKKLT